MTHNCKGVNCEGLLDMDPCRIIVPILHCPMGLVDKILKSFVSWINKEVENFNDPNMEALCEMYLMKEQQQKASTLSCTQASAFAWANPTSNDAKTNVRDTNKV